MQTLKVGLAPSRSIEIEIAGLNGHAIGSVIELVAPTANIKLPALREGLGTVAYKFDVAGKDLTFVDPNGTTKTVTIGKTVVLSASVWQNKRTAQTGLFEVTISDGAGSRLGGYSFAEGDVDSTDAEAGESYRNTPPVIQWIVDHTVILA